MANQAGGLGWLPGVSGEKINILKTITFQTSLCIEIILNTSSFKLN